MGAALRILETGDANPHFFNYPSLTIYLQVLVSALIRAWEQLMLGRAPHEIPINHFFSGGRLLVVLLSTLTIGITGEIGRRLVHPLAGVLAACFLATSSLHVANSVTLTVDSPMALWSCLALLMAVSIQRDGGQVDGRGPPG